MGEGRLSEVVSAPRALLAALAVGVVGMMVVSLWWARSEPEDVALIAAEGASSAETDPSTGAESEVSPPSTTPEPGSPEATRLCEARLAQYAGRDNEMNVSLVAAYASTAADVAADDERRRGADYRSPWRDRPPGEFEAVCIFDADAFGIAGPPPPPGSSREAYDRLQEVVRPDGAPVVHQAGRKDTLKAEPIPAEAGR